MVFSNNQAAKEYILQNGDGILGFITDLRRSDVLGGHHHSDFGIEFCRNLIREWERWSRKFGPVAKVDRYERKAIQNEETKEPFGGVQSQGCA